LLASEEESAFASAAIAEPAPPMLKIDKRARLSERSNCRDNMVVVVVLQVPLLLTHSAPEVRTIA
jgi:hypothetical protein